MPYPSWQDEQSISTSDKHSLPWTRQTSTSPNALQNGSGKLVNPAGTLTALCLVPADNPAYISLGARKRNVPESSRSALYVPGFANSACTLKKDEDHQHQRITPGLMLRLYHPPTPWYFS